MTADQHIKDVIKSISDLTLLISDVTQGFSFQEVSLLVSLVSDLKTSLKDAPYLLDEYKTLDEEARSDLYSYIESQIQFPANSNIQMIVEKSLELLVSASQVFTLFGVK